MFKLISFKGDEAFWPFTERSDLDPASQSRSVIGGMLAAPWRVVAALARELAARRAMQALSSLDERMLRDIGLDQSQIPHAVREGRRAVTRMQDLRADIVRWS
jgi:uncharacterized protein YjiS (DUF1127 family)